MVRPADGATKAASFSFLSYIAMMLTMKAILFIALSVLILPATTAASFDGDGDDAVQVEQGTTMTMKKCLNSACLRSCVLTISFHFAFSQSATDEIDQGVVSTYLGEDIDLEQLVKEMGFTTEEEDRDLLDLDPLKDGKEGGLRLRRHLIKCYGINPPRPLFDMQVRWLKLYVHYTGDDYGDYEEWKVDLTLGDPGYDQIDTSKECDPYVDTKRVNLNVRDRNNPRMYDFPDVWQSRMLEQGQQYELRVSGKEDDGGWSDDHLPMKRVIHRQGHTGYWQWDAWGYGRKYTIFYQLYERQRN